MFSFPGKNGLPSSPGVPRHGVDQEVPVQALLRGRPPPVVVRAHAELKEAHVVGRQLHANLDHLEQRRKRHSILQLFFFYFNKNPFFSDLVLLVLPGNDALPVHPAGFVGAGLKKMGVCVCVCVL